jgi:hypothetical protein
MTADQSQNDPDEKPAVRVVHRWERLRAHQRQDFWWDVAFVGGIVLVVVAMVAIALIFRNK